MATWAERHPNWREKAAVLGWGADRIRRIAAGGDPGPQALKEYNSLKGTNWRPQPTPPPGAPGGAPVFNQSAYNLFGNYLSTLGLSLGGDIEAIVRKAVIDGYTPAQFELLVPEIQNTETFKQRFPGYHARIANGYNAITVGRYLELEDQFYRILSSAGLPAGFYDDRSDMGNWIAKNVSPDELQFRVNAAVDMARQVDPTARDLLGKFYGVGVGDIAAFFLDSNRALPELDRQYRAVGIAAWAKRVGLEPVSAQRFEDLADKGVTEQQAAQGYATVKAFSDNIGHLGQVHGIAYDQSDAERDVFFNDTEKRRRIVARERAAFGGRAGVQGGRRASTAGTY